MKNSSSSAIGSIETYNFNLIKYGSEFNRLLKGNSFISIFQNMMFGVAVIIFVWMNVQNMVA